MPRQVIQRRSRGFICVNAHPVGCARVVEQQVAAVRRAFPSPADGPRNVLVIGASTGYGLASRVVAAWGFGAKTLGVFFEKEPSGKRTASAGWYNTAALRRRAAEDGLHVADLNGDAFSDDVKGRVADLARREFGKFDVVVYSLAAPRRVNPRTGEILASALKPIGRSYAGKTIELGAGAVGEATVEPASDEEIRQTIGVMGGEDWRWWIDKLLAEDLLADGARAIAYSYVGPKLTWPIYRSGTIGRAKQDLEQAAADLDRRLAERLGGGAWVSVNKAVVTQASAAIPVVPLYISLLFRVMKRKGLHEDCVEQMIRLFKDRLPVGARPETDAEGLIRLDDWEMRPDVQAAVEELWPRVETANLEELTDFAGMRSDFHRLFGFDVEGVDYDQPVETEIAL